MAKDVYEHTRILFNTIIYVYTETSKHDSKKTSLSREPWLEIWSEQTDSSARVAINVHYL